MTPAITTAAELDALREELDALRGELDAAHRLALRLSQELDAERATASAYRAETVRLTLHAADVRDERDAANSRWRALLARVQKHPDALWLTDVEGSWAADESPLDPTPATEGEGER